MPPKKAIAAAAAARDAAPKKRVAAAKKTTIAETKTAEKKTTTAATAKKAAPARKAAPAAAAKKAAPEKTAAAAKKPATRKTQKSSEESDKENSGTQTKAKAKMPASKRKREQEEEEEEQAESEDEGSEVEERAAKRTKTELLAAQAAEKPKKAAPKKAASKPKPATTRKSKKSINEAPTQVMDIFVFGEGSSGELGLGSMKYEGKKPIDVKRPRINHNLQGKNVVQVACGGMHVAVLTKDNKILTWGVNDQGALGRNTDWAGGLRDVEDEESDTDDDDSGLNPHESTPGEVDMSGIEEDVQWAQVVACDSATFALTEAGDVYGWGTFRVGLFLSSNHFVANLMQSNEGILGFRKDVKVQRTPMKIPELSKIKQLAAGANHVLAMDEKHKISAWGSGQQSQLARRLLERDPESALLPGGIGFLPNRAKAETLTCGAYHSFVIDQKQRVIGWGLNNYAELGIATDAGEDNATILKPQVVSSLLDVDVTEIAAGEHHSLACTTEGELITWGRIDGHQVGHPEHVYTRANAIWDESQRPRILVQPTAIEGLSNIVKVAAGTDHSFAITKDGKVYSWGFSTNYQTGQGTTDDIKTPTLIDNTAIRGRKIIWAGAGGQYSILGALPEATLNGS